MVIVSLYRDWTKMLTLRQVEVIRAVMVTGSISGASRLLNVAQPGLSRTIKHVEGLLKVRLFSRQGGRFVPSPEARYVFDQVQELNRKMEDLNFAIERLNSGTNVEMRVGSVPSIGNVMVPRSVARVCKAFPDLLINLDIIKVEDCADYLLLGKGELVVISHKLDHSGLDFEPLAAGKLVCICSPAHELASHHEISVREIAKFPLIGIEPKDPYGKIIVQLFAERDIAYNMRIKARFGTSVCGLVKQNLGIAIIDIFTVADTDTRDLAIIPIKEPTEFQTFVAKRADVNLSSFAEAFVNHTRAAMREVMRGPVANFRS